MSDDTSSASGSSLHGLRGLQIDATARQPRKRSRLWTLLLSLVLVLGIGGLGRGLYRMTLGKPAVVQVAFARLSSADSPAAGPVLSGAGYVVTGSRYISIGVRVPGRIDAYEVQEGDFVEKGDVLVRLDSRSYRAQVQKTEATLTLARANVVLKQKQAKRTRELHRRGLIAEQNLDEAENELAVAQATVSQAQADVALTQIDLDYAVLRAPTSGIVLEKLKEVGMIAVPGGFDGSGDLIRIANLSDLRGEVDINEADFRGVHMGQQTEVIPDAYTDRTYPAKVVKIYPRVNRQKGTVKVEVKLENVDAYLRPDMSVRINFMADVPETNDAEGAPQVIVPKVALRGQGKETFVWTVREEQLRRLAVQVGADLGDTVQIMSGLNGGEALVISEAENLDEGRQVHVSDD